MISGLSRETRRLAWLLAIAASPAQTAHAQQSPWGVGELMRSLHQVKSASGQFVERRTMEVLTEPLVASGTLLYVAPDQVQKITISPKRERFALSGDTLTIEGGDEDRTRTMSLADNPEVGAFVEGIRATLAGDLPQLSRLYTIHLDGSAADWQLSLQPIDAKLTQYIKSIRIAGSDNRIKLVETQEGNGDRSEMRIVEDVR